MYFKVALIVLFFREISGKIAIFPKVLNFLEYGENKLCRMESNIYKNNLRNYTVWAHKMFDSSAKGAFGVLRGNDHQLGNYKECLNIRGPFPTQYCLVGLTVNVPPRNSTGQMLDQHGSVLTKLENFRIKNLKLGLCFPSSCSASDIQTSLTETLSKVEKPFDIDGITYNVSSTKEFCSNYVYPKKFGKMEITFCTLTAVLLIMVFISTMWDFFKTEEEDPNKVGFPEKLFLSFSARANWNELFRTYSNQEETRIFDGVRSISIIFIFFAHLLANYPIVPRLNGLLLDKILTSRIYIAVEKIDLFVDIFFIMSGLLLVHRILTKWNGIKGYPILIVFFRYVRLTPLHIYVTLYFSTMLIYLGSGPVWNLTYLMFIRNCDINNNWWLNFFYFNNFMKDANDSCNFMSWFISCDFQLCILGIIVMFVMQKNRRVGYALLGFLFVLSTIATFSITKIYKIIPHMGIYGTEEFRKYWNIYYVKPYTRGSSYIVGMVGGIMYVKLKSKKVKISKIISYTIIGISLLVMVVSYAYFILAFNGEENFVFEFALYNALHRPLWCIGVLGIFIVTSFGSIPALRLFLSSSVWTPFAKLSYGFYLIHFMVQISTITTSVTAIHSNLFYTTSVLFITEYMLTFAVALFLYVVVEVPLVRILRVTLQRIFYEEQQSIQSQENKAVEGSVTTEIETISQEELRY